MCCNFAHFQIVSFQTYQLVKPINRQKNKLILARINLSNGEIFIFLTLIESRNSNTKTSYEKPNHYSFTRLERNKSLVKKITRIIAHVNYRVPGFASGNILMRANSLPQTFFHLSHSQIITPLTH